jgi:hypothetical protein
MFKADRTCVNHGIFRTLGLGLGLAFAVGLGLAFAVGLGLGLGLRFTVSTRRS